MSSISRGVGAYQSAPAFRYGLVSMDVVMGWEVVSGSSIPRRESGQGERVAIRHGRYSSRSFLGETSLLVVAVEGCVVIEVEAVCGSELWCLAKQQLLQRTAISRQ